LRWHLIKNRGLKVASLARNADRLASFDPDRSSQVICFRLLSPCPEVCPPHRNIAHRSFGHRIQSNKNVPTDILPAQFGLMFLVVIGFRLSCEWGTGAELAGPTAKERLKKLLTRAFKLDTIFLTMIPLSRVASGR
jgi:hypothetical protein